MKKAIFGGIVLIGTIFFVYVNFFKTKPMAINISSPAFENGADIPKKYGCQGENISPPLVINGVSAEAKSLVLIVDDPDAPGGVWNHWLVWNINPQQKKISENSSPQGATVGINDFGKTAYGGPCPPSGVHRYFFRLYALNSPIDLGPMVKRGILDRAMKGKIIGQGELMGRYSH